MVNNSRSIPSSPKALLKHLQTSLSSIYNGGELNSICFHLLEHYFKVDRTAIIVNDPIPDIEQKKKPLLRALERLNQHEPMQYVLGAAQFYGHTFKVNPAVLIPRSETEALVDLIIMQNAHKPLKILDIGTGSGCISVCLKLAMPQASLFAIEVDLKALNCARQNAKEHNVNINFAHADILKDQRQFDQVDVIVSNPPYVLVNEKPLMQRNVLDFEPHLALFVADNNPFIFYKAILEKARSILVPGGRIYFEINERFGREINELLFSYKYIDIDIIKDIHNKDRIATAIKDT